MLKSNIEFSLMLILLILILTNWSFSSSDFGVAWIFEFVPLFNTLEPVSNVRVMFLIKFELLFIAYKNQCKVINKVASDVNQKWNDKKKELFSKRDDMYDKK